MGSKGLPVTESTVSVQGILTKAERTPLWTEEDVHREDLSEFVDSTFASRYTAQPIAKNKWASGASGACA